MPFELKCLLVMQHFSKDFSDDLVFTILSCTYNLIPANIDFETFKLKKRQEKNRTKNKKEELQSFLTTLNIKMFGMMGQKVSSRLA